MGDTLKKNLYLDAVGLKNIKFFELAHGKLPDVLVYLRSKNWLYLIEAVTTANPITELRRNILIEAAVNCTVELIFVTAFLDKNTSCWLEKRLELFATRTAHPRKSCAEHS